MIAQAYRADLLAEKLIQKQRQIDALQLEMAGLAFEFSEGQVWREAGFHNAVDWIRFNCHVTSTVAAAYLRVGKHEAELAESTQAMDKGEIGYAHLKVMARTAEAVGPVFHEAELLPLAKKHSAGKFYAKCLHYQHSVDAKGFEQGQEALYEKRWLKLSTAENGCLLINGGLDPVNGIAVRTALEALAKRAGKKDGRTREARLADAFVELSTNGSGGRQNVAINVTASLETLLGLVGAPGAENEFSLPISAKTVERWACDCTMSRVLLQDSVVIDVGRAERTIKGPRRRALMARDQHCRWTGCDRPASWCDGHHVVHWLHGGGGEIENQILLCRRHHRLVHEGGWQIIKTEEGRLMPVAPSTRFGRPREPGYI